MKHFIQNVAFGPGSYMPYTQRSAAVPLSYNFIAAVAALAYYICAILVMLIRLKCCICA